MDLQDIWEGVDWIHLSQDRNMWQALVDIVMKLQVPQNAGNFLTSRGTFSFSRKVLLHGDLIIHSITQHHTHSPIILYSEITILKC